MTAARRIRSSTVLQWLLMIVVLTGTSGCPDLSAIRNYANQSVDAAQYTTLVNDYTESPSRKKPFEPQDKQPALDLEAKNRAEQKKRMLARLTAVQEYMAALGQLAADKAVDYGADVDAVGKALKDAKFGNQNEVDAISAITKILLRAVTDTWRQRQLREIIEQANDPLQTVIKAQRDIVQKDFSESLDIEETVITTYYGNFLRPPDAKKDTLGFEAIKELRDQRLEPFVARKQTVVDYGRVLDKIADGHQKLYDNRAHIKSEMLLKTAQQYAKDIQTIMKSIKDLR